jgi:hypothetical protein
VTGRWFTLGTLVSSINTTDCQDISEVLLKVALNTKTLTLYCSFFCCILHRMQFHKWLTTCSMHFEIISRHYWSDCQKKTDVIFFTRFSKCNYTLGLISLIMILKYWIIYTERFKSVYKCKCTKFCFVQISVGFLSH